MTLFARMLSTVSSAMLLMMGVAANASTSPPGKDAKVTTGQIFTVELLSEFVILTQGNYAERSIAAAVDSMLDAFPATRAPELPAFVRELRALGLDPAAEIAVIEALLSKLEEVAGVDVEFVTGAVLDQFVGSVQVAATTITPIVPVPAPLTPPNNNDAGNNDDVIEPN